MRGHHTKTSYLPGDVIDQWSYVHDPGAGHYVPTAGRAGLRLNLWINEVSLGGAPPPAPAGGATVEVVVTDVTYMPEPPRAALVLSGVAALGLLARRRVR